jgi:hypothetical protein
MATPCPHRAAPIAALSAVFALYTFGYHRKLVKPGCLTLFVVSATVPALANLIFYPRYPELTLRRAEVTFPTVRPGQIVNRSVILTNTGMCGLTGTVGTLPAPFAVVAGGGPFKLRVGDSAVIRVRVAPQPEFQAGEMTAQLVIRSNDPKQAVVRVPVKAVVQSAREGGGGTEVTLRSGGVPGVRGSGQRAGG